MRLTRVIPLGLIGIAIFGLSWYFLAPQFSQQEEPTLAATVLNSPSQLTDFKLLDSNGATFTHRRLRGKWSLLFFGYRKCPDICPLTLNTMRSTWQLFKEPPAQFVFVSITPNEDSRTLAGFLHNFDPRFLGVTGSESELSKLTKQLGIFANASKDNPELIDHTAHLMLIDPKGSLKAIFAPPLDPSAIAADLKNITKA